MKSYEPQSPIDKEHKQQTQELHEVIKRMGIHFAYIDCESALKDCNWNKDRALDHITSGQYKPWKTNKNATYQSHNQKHKDMQFGAPRKQHRQQYVDITLREKTPEPQHDSQVESVFALNPLTQVEFIPVETKQSKQAETKKDQPKKATGPAIEIVSFDKAKKEEVKPKKEQSKKDAPKVETRVIAQKEAHKALAPKVETVDIPIIQNKVAQPKVEKPKNGEPKKEIIPEIKVDTAPVAVQKPVAQAPVQQQLQQQQVPQQQFVPQFSQPMMMPGQMMPQMMPGQMMPQMMPGQMMPQMMPGQMMPQIMPGQMMPQMMGQMPFMGQMPQSQIMQMMPQLVQVPGPNGQMQQFYTYIPCYVPQQPPK